MLHVKLAVQRRKMPQAERDFLQERVATDRAGRHLVRLFAVNAPQFRQMSEQCFPGCAEPFQMFGHGAACQQLSDFFTDHRRRHRRSAQTDQFHIRRSDGQCFEHLVFTADPAGDRDVRQD